MLTIKLKVNETVAGHLYWFLSKFSKDEIEILEENPEFNKIQNYLTEELRQIDSGSVKLMTVEEAETEIEKTIRKYES